MKFLTENFGIILLVALVALAWQAGLFEQFLSSPNKTAQDPARPMPNGPPAGGMPIDTIDPQADTGDLKSSEEVAGMQQQDSQDEMAINTGGLDPVPSDVEQEVQRLRKI